MKFLAVQHVPFERPGLIETWALENGHTVLPCRMHAGDALPGLDSFDFYVSMGGPMGVEDSKRIPFLAEEMTLMKRAAAAGKPVLGVCLGAQLLAAALGARVFRNEHREIGWMPVERVIDHPFFSDFPAVLSVLHWHGDTFELPRDSVHVLKSEACRHQAFVRGRAVGLQFHLEMTESSLREIIENCRSELAPGPHVHSEQQMLADAPAFTAACKDALYSLLGRMTRDAGR